MDLKHNNISYPQFESVSKSGIAKEESDDGWMVAVPRTAESRDNGCDGDDVDDDGDCDDVIYRYGTALLCLFVCLPATVSIQLGTGIELNVVVCRRYGVGRWRADSRGISYRCWLCFN